MQFIICLVVLTVLLHIYCSVMAQRQHQGKREPTWVSLYTYVLTSMFAYNNGYNTFMSALPESDIYTSTD